MQPLPNHHCPLCGKLNACAPAASGDFNTPCWCTSVTIDPATLAQIPAHMQQQACLCADCAQRSEATASDIRRRKL